jgi:hypothetical protein
MNSLSETEAELSLFPSRVVKHIVNASILEECDY